MKRNFNKGQGFTLIEMMIVMLVIIVLAGMVFKLMGVAGAKNEEANTKATLQKVANALEEYRAIYGKYPPVYSYPGLGQPVRYEFANARYLEAEVGPEFAQYLKNASKDGDIWTKDTGRLFTFGLLSYFVPRYKGHADRAPPIFVGGEGDDPDTENSDESETYSKARTINQWEVHNVRRSSERMSQFDLQENIDSARKILPYLGGALNADGSVASYGIIRQDWIGTSFEGKAYHNDHLYIWDGWEREIRFQSNPPHDTYKLWSLGPDGRDGTSDDIVLTSE